MLRKNANDREISKKKEVDKKTERILASLSMTKMCVRERA